MEHPEFIGLVHSLVHTGEAALGQLNVLSGRLQRDGVERSRQTAERSLKLLEALAAKTRGNLNAAEAEAITRGIGSLRDGLRDLEHTRAVT
jgi:hypothetical protein